MLDLDPARPGAPLRDAATLIVIREAFGGASGLELFCVERQKMGFLGGAVVFPGGKLDPADLDPAWAGRATPMREAGAALAEGPEQLRGLGVAACREALEEAAILPLAGTSLGHATLLTWRARLARTRERPAETTLLALLNDADVKVDLSALHPLARWVTPVAESRRFDARFFLYVADAALTGAHDEYETTASFWAAPSEVLRRFAAGELQLAPPTHRTLEMLAMAASPSAALAMAAAASLEPVCPRLVKHADGRGETIALALPGDREHEAGHVITPGRSRYVLRGDRFLPEDAP